MQFFQISKTSKNLFSECVICLHKLDLGLLYCPSSQGSNYPCVGLLYILRILTLIVVVIL